jgi:hypothetical protein
MGKYGENVNLNSWKFENLSINGDWKGLAHRVEGVLFFQKELVIRSLIWEI